MGNKVAKNMLPKKLTFSHQNKSRQTAKRILNDSKVLNTGETEKHTLFFRFDSLQGFIQHTFALCNTNSINLFLNRDHACSILCLTFSKQDLF